MQFPTQKNAKKESRSNQKRGLGLAHGKCQLAQLRDLAQKSSDQAKAHPIRYFRDKDLT